MSGAVVLETARLRLRTATPDDAQFYLELVNDPSWLANIGQRHIHSLDAARAALAAGPMAQQQAHGYSFYIVQRRSDGALLGMCGMILRESLPGPDIGYAMRPFAWGQGYAFEAAASVLQHARDVLRLPTLYGITAPHNQASINLLNKLGLRFERFARLPPAGKDTNIYCKHFRRMG